MRTTEAQHSYLIVGSYKREGIYILESDWIISITANLITSPHDQITRISPEQMVKQSRRPILSKRENQLQQTTFANYLLYRKQAMLLLLFGLLHFADKTSGFCPHLEPAVLDKEALEGHWFILRRTVQDIHPDPDCGRVNVSFQVKNQRQFLQTFFRTQKFYLAMFFR